MAQIKIAENTDRGWVDIVNIKKSNGLFIEHCQSMRCRPGSKIKAILVVKFKLIISDNANAAAVLVEESSRQIDTAIFAIDPKHLFIALANYCEWKSIYFRQRAPEKDKYFWVGN